MNFENATRKQLLQVALHENCDMDYKYEAARELQLRQWHDGFLPDLIRMWGNKETTYDIAAELGIPETTVRSQLFKYGLYGKRVTA